MGTEINAYLGHDTLTVNDLLRPVFEENNQEQVKRFLKEQLALLDTPGKKRESRLFRSCNHLKLRQKGTMKPLLWLIPGSLRLAQHETDMGAATRSSKNEKSSTVKVGLCHYILSQLKQHFDFILVDLSPTCSALNMVMVMSSDFVLPPCFLDM